MHTILLLSASSRSTAGVLLLTIVAIEYGGWFMLRVVRDRHRIDTSKYSLRFFLPFTFSVTVNKRLFHD